MVLALNNQRRTLYGTASMAPRRGKVSMAPRRGKVAPAPRMGKVALAPRHGVGKFFKKLGRKLKKGGKKAGKLTNKAINTFDKIIPPEVQEQLAQSNPELQGALKVKGQARDAAAFASSGQARRDMINKAHQDMLQRMVEPPRHGKRRRRRPARRGYVSKAR